MVGMALGVTPPNIDATGAFERGAQGAQTQAANRYALAEKGLQLIGSAGMHALNGDMNAEPDPQRYEEGLDMLASHGVDVSHFRGKPHLAKAAVRGSISAFQHLQLNQADRNSDIAMQNMQAAWQRLQMDIEKAERDASAPMEVNGQLVDRSTHQVIGDYRTPAAPPTPPAGIQEYQIYSEQERAAGREPVPLIEYKRLTKEGTVVNVGAGETAYDKKQGELLATDRAGIREASRSGTRALTTLDAMEQLMADPNFYSGTGSEQITGLKRLAASVGIDPNAVSSIETFNALAKNAALETMGGSLGAGFSNADRGFVLEQVPTLGNTVEGNKLLIEVQRGLALRKVEIERFARWYEQEHGQLDSGFETALAEWAEENPVFPKDGAGGLNAPTIDTPGAFEAGAAAGRGEVYARNPQTGERLVSRNGGPWEPVR